MTQEMVPRGTRQVEGFGSREIARQDVSVAAGEAQATAAVQAKHIMAWRNPRRTEWVEQELLTECGRPEFALLARYARPVGGGKVATGWSIRFAESCISALGNIEISSRMVHESDTEVAYEVSVIDFQRNIHICEQISLSKTVERSNPDGREVIGQRTNSSGKPVYIVRSTEDEMYAKIRSRSARVKRDAIRLVRGSTLDACEAKVAETLANLPPADKIKLMLRSFEQVQIRAVDIQAYLGHPISRPGDKGALTYTITPEEVEELRTIYAAIKSNELTWDAAMAARNPSGSAADAEALAEQKLAAMREAAGMPQNQPTADDALPAPTTTESQTTPPPRKNGFKL